MKKDIAFEEYKIIVGKRIKQARLMAEFKTIKDFNIKVPQWAESRMGNYEIGHSLPKPLDIHLIAKITGTNPCWITFGMGSIRATSRDLQAIRHQNLVYFLDQLPASDHGELRKSAKLKKAELNLLKSNPFLKLTDTVCRRFEKYFEKRKGWMDEQHIDADGLCQFFPEDLRELMTIFSELESSDKSKLLNIAKIFVNTK